MQGCRHGAPQSCTRTACRYTVGRLCTETPSSLVLFEAEPWMQSCHAPSACIRSVWRSSCKLAPVGSRHRCLQHCRPTGLSSSMPAHARPDLLQHSHAKHCNCGPQTQWHCHDAIRQASRLSCRHAAHGAVVVHMHTAACCSMKIGCCLPVFLGLPTARQATPVSPEAPWSALALWVAPDQPAALCLTSQQACTAAHPQNQGSQQRTCPAKCWIAQIGHRKVQCAECRAAFLPSQNSALKEAVRGAAASTVHPATGAKTGDIPLNSLQSGS
jgi:hypothetical protein